MDKPLGRFALVALVIFACSSLPSVASIDASMATEWQIGLGDATSRPERSVTLPSGHTYLVGQKDADCFISLIQPAGIHSESKVFGFTDAYCDATRIDVYDSKTLVVSARKQLKANGAVYGEILLFNLSKLDEFRNVFSLEGEIASAVNSDRFGNIFLTTGSGSIGAPIFVRKIAPSKFSSKKFIQLWQTQSVTPNDCFASVWDLEINESSQQLFVGVNREKCINSSLVISYQLEDGRMDWERVSPGNIFGISAESPDKSDSVLVAGSSLLSADGFLMKLSRSGKVIWQTGVVTPQEDFVTDVSVDDSGRIILIGATRGSVSGPSRGGLDSFISTYDSSGRVLSKYQFGSANDEEASSVQVDRLGRIYVFGWLYPTVNATEHNAFLTRFAKFESRDRPPSVRR